MSCLGMAKFYFDISEGDLLHRDDEGSEHADVSSAEREAVETAATLGRDRLPGSKAREIVVEVRDQTNKLVVVAKVTMEVVRF